MLNYTVFSFLLFLVGMLGIFVTRKNLIIILMSIELMLLAINVNFIVYSVYLDDLAGQVFALFVLTVAAAESAIGLALLVAYYRVKGTVSSLFINSLKG
jgi:NADH-quinone oxidoreductase subunit K